MVQFDNLMAILSLYGPKIAFGCLGYVKDIIIILGGFLFL